MEVIHADIYSCKPYTVHAGKLRDDDDRTHYLVMHDKYNVVEYETDILAAAIAWAQHFASELTKLEAGEKSDTTAELGQNILPFGRPN